MSSICQRRDVTDYSPPEGIGILWKGLSNRSIWKPLCQFLSELAAYVVEGEGRCSRIHSVAGVRSYWTKFNDTQG
jgi:hypothetical protein